MIRLIRLLTELVKQIFQLTNVEICYGLRNITMLLRL